MERITVLCVVVASVLAPVGLVGMGFGNSDQADAANEPNPLASEAPAVAAETEAVVADEKELHPMAIESLRNGVYPEGDFLIEEKLENGTNYEQYIASYISEGLKIFGLLTVPLAEKPENGFPAIVFVHGYIPPDQYTTTGNYATYQARLARAEFITFKPDLRGHGNSEGDPVNVHYSEKYVIDTLNAIAHLNAHEAVDSKRIAYWGHSDGGEIGLRVVVASPLIKAASLWSGMVGSYVDMFETHNPVISFLQDVKESDLVVNNGLPSSNPQFWNTLDPYHYLDEIQVPIQIQHGTADTSVPIALSLHLREELEARGKAVEYFEYEGDDHNIRGNVDLAFQRSIEFYRQNL